MLEDLVEQLAAPHQVEDEVDVAVALEEVTKRDDARMLTVPKKDLDFFGAVTLRFVNYLKL